MVLAAGCEWTDLVQVKGDHHICQSYVEASEVDVRHWQFMVRYTLEKSRVRLLFSDSPQIVTLHCNESPSNPIITAPMLMI